MKKSIFFSAVIALSFFDTVSAQTLKTAKENLRHYDYFSGMQDFQALLSQDPSDPEINYYVGLCYLKTNIDKKRALKHFIKAKNTKKPFRETFYYLGVAQMLNNEFTNASQSLLVYLENPGKFEINAELRLKQCISAQKLIENPKNVTYINLGKRINSIYDDYYPFVTLDGDKLIFTSRRKQNKGQKEIDGYYSSDIWISNKINKQFEVAQNAGSVNTVFDEQVVGLTADGTQVIVYQDVVTSFGDLFKAEIKDDERSYSRKIPLDEVINSPAIETSGSLSPDGNTMFFSSNRNGSIGQNDLFLVRKLPNGKWGRPQNLGQNINSPLNEDFPTISPDGKTLYFSSEGHPGMGGYDLFKSIWDSENNNWSKAENLGYPVNTSDDERVISFKESQTRAYISALRPEGMGRLDIYEVIFHDLIKPIHIELTVYYANKLIKTGAIMVYNDQDELIGEFAAHPSKDHFLLILDPGKYKIDCEAPDGKITTVDVTLEESDNIQIIKKVVNIQP